MHITGAQEKSMEEELEEPEVIVNKRGISVWQRKRRKTSQVGREGGADPEQV